MVVMDKIIIQDEPFAVVKYSPEYKMVHVVWNGNVTDDQYRKTFTKALDFQEQSGLPAYNFLSDIRNQGLINPENRKWFENNAVPRAVKQGLRRGAVVFDGSVFKKYYLNLILQSLNRFKIPFKFFRSPKDAFEWFSSFDDLA